MQYANEVRKKSLTARQAEVVFAAMIIPGMLWGGVVHVRFALEMTARQAKAQYGCEYGAPMPTKAPAAVVDNNTGPRNSHGFIAKSTERIGEIPMKKARLL